MYQSSMPAACHLPASLSEFGNANYPCFPNWPHPAFEVSFHFDVIARLSGSDAVSWLSKDRECADGLIQLPLVGKQTEKGQGGKEKAAAVSGSCLVGEGCSGTFPGGTRTAFPTRITHCFGLGLSGTQAQKGMFYFIPCIKKGCSAGRWVTVVVKGCARNKVG